MSYKSGLHLESSARGCKTVVLEIRGGGWRSSAYMPMAMYLPKILGGVKVHLGGPIPLLAPSYKCSPVNLSSTKFTMIVQSTEHAPNVLRLVRIAEIIIHGIAHNLPVVDYKDNNLDQVEQKWCQVRNTSISVIHTREVHNVNVKSFVTSFQFPFQVVDEGDSGSFLVCSSRVDLLQKEI